MYSDSPSRARTSFKPAMVGMEALEEGGIDMTWVSSVIRGMGMGQCDYWKAAPIWQFPVEQHPCRRQKLKGNNTWIAVVRWCREKDCGLDFTRRTDIFCASLKPAARWPDIPNPRHATHVDSKLTA
jgi:hypothetical protein